jgi:hypothetical protein
LKVKGTILPSLAVTSLRSKLPERSVIALDREWPTILLPNRRRASRFASATRFSRSRLMASTDPVSIT